MSDPYHPAVDASLFAELLNWSGEDLFRNQQSPPLWKKSSCVLPEEGTSWPGSEDCVAMSITENVGTQSDSDDDVVKVQGWVGDNKHPSMRMKRKQFGYPQEAQAPVNHSRERQRGKNWEKTEEDILVELKGKDMDWKSISECLKSNGFIRDHRHCSDKWYALRKHYLEIQQWMAQHPNTQYWNLPESERIRTVPSSFCQRWYQIFDAASQKPEVRKRVHLTLNQRRKPDSGRRLATDPSPSHSGPAVVGLTLDYSARPDPAFTARPSCPPSVPQEGSHQYAGYSGDATQENERREAGDFLANQAMAEYSNLPNESDIRMLWAEVRDLIHTLNLKFAAEEAERLRNFEIKERKLQLKIDRFQYKRQRDEEKRRRPGTMP